MWINIIDVWRYLKERIRYVYLKNSFMMSILDSIISFWSKVEIYYWNSSAMKLIDVLNIWRQLLGACSWIIIAVCPSPIRYFERIDKLNIIK